MRSAMMVIAGLTLCSCSPPPPGISIEPFSWRPSLAEVDEALLSVCGVDDLVAVGGANSTGFAASRSDDLWIQDTLPAGTGVLWWCWDSPSTRIYAVGEARTIVRRNQNRVWETMNMDPVVPEGTTLFGVWGSSDDDVFAVGGSPNLPGQPPIIAHYDGATWSAADTSSLGPGALFKIWGTAGDRAWAVGQNGAIHFFDGSTWQQQPSPTQEVLISLWGTGATDIYAVGGDASGLVLHYDGRGWSTFASTPQRLSAVWTETNAPLYVAGDRGFVARYRQGSDDGVSNKAPRIGDAPQNLCFHSLHGANGTVYGAAADLISGGRNGFRSVILATGVPMEGALTRAPDAGIPPDSGAFGGSMGPGESCDTAPTACAAELECLGIDDFTSVICTQQCDDASECTDFGQGACCVVPGPQVINRYCLPGTSPSCSP